MKVQRITNTNGLDEKHTEPYNSLQCAYLTSFYACHPHLST